MASRSRNNTTVLNPSSKLHEEVIVGLDEDARSVMDRLVEDGRQLDIISIVGMGGQGKTTLATKIFNDRYVEHHFYVRGWVTVSQTYTKRDLLKGLLESIGKSVNEAITEPTLRDMLHKSLFRRRYFIVIDDIWSVDAWKDLRRCFSDDNTGSRILLTTRLMEVASDASPGGFTHNLQSLTDEESLDLLCRKTFRGYECPKSLTEIGKDIARKCRGLPLALVVIAGLLEKAEKNKAMWEKVAKSVNSYVMNGPYGCLDTLALSYDHLPRHLKNCFLYVGGFPEDYNIRVTRLISLWMAEGFILVTGQRSLEEEAENYLIDLVERNLLIVADKRSDGRIGSCRLHDLLRELCLKKATEENFFKRITQQDNYHSNITKPRRGRSLEQLDYDSSEEEPRRLFTLHEVLPEICSQRSVRSVLCIYSGENDEIISSSRYVTRIWFHSFLLLKVLDILNLELVDLNGVGRLIHLRYLAVWIKDTDFSPTLTNFSSLQTLLVEGISIRYPLKITGKLMHLRHFWSRNRYSRIESFFSVDPDCPVLFNLQSISRLILYDLNLLRSFPNIKKLACSVSKYCGNYYSLNFSVLTHLEALNLETDMLDPLYLEHPVRFPETLKRLTLKGLRLPWSCMSTIHQLPSLEVLKLLGSSFKGLLWSMGSERFRKLKFLKLDKLEIELWETSSNNFPRLRKLVIGSCRNLKEIPLEIGDISTLEQIEIKHSNIQLRESIEKIQEEQHALGNDDIHVKFIGKTWN